MKLLIRCFGCKKRQKKTYDKNVNCSKTKFTSMVTSEGIMTNQVVPHIKNKIEKEKKKEDNNTNIGNNKDVLINEEEEDKDKKIKESLISDEPEKDNKNNIDNNYTKLGLNLNKEIGFEEPLLKPDSPLICDYEKNLTFTKKNFIELFNRLWNLDKYKKIWDKDNLSIEIRSEGSELNSEFFLIKIIYRQLKTEIIKENANVQAYVDFLYEPSLRILWDKVLKNIEIHEGDKTSNYILNTWVKSPVFFMSERDCLEKRFIYKNPNEKATYIMSSSIPEDIFPLKTDVVRITNYCNYYKIIDEGEYIGFHSLNQTDFKMPIPQFLVNATLPTTTKDWQNKLIQFSKEVIYDKTTFNVTYINKSDENK